MELWNLWNLWNHFKYRPRRPIARAGSAKPLPHLPTDMDQRIMKQDFAWAAKNRERILAEWERRYGQKADPKKS